ncbi:translation initiation factor eIF-2B subunit alpha [Globomyces pollinis-pini]|nr:translation initiation factor eIF-2B subunit alpha [Globomyces pollinis-pini]
MVQFDIVKTLKSIQAQNPNLALPVQTVKALIKYTQQSNCSTATELTVEIGHLFSTLQQSDISVISATAGKDVFLKLVTKNPIKDEMKEFRDEIIEEANEFVERCEHFRQIAADFGLNFIKDNSTILIHSHSRLVMLLLKSAALRKKHFQVYVCQGSPSNGGSKAVLELRKANIPAALISDAAIGYIMEKVDFVLVGAEGIVRNGGIINQIGTYPLALVAKAADKPLYCVAESYKFIDVFPLNQDDLDLEKNSSVYFTNEEDGGKCKISNPSVDYTPPELVTFLFTNEGVLAPSGVSELLLEMVFTS